MTTTNACLKSKLCLTEHKVRSWSEARSRGQKPGHEVRSQVLRSETKSRGQKPGHKYRNKITNQVLRSETRSRTSSQNYKPGHNVRSRSQGRKPDHEIASLVMRSETMSRWQRPKLGYYAINQVMRTETRVLAIRVTRSIHLKMSRVEEAIWRSPYKNICICSWRMSLFLSRICWLLFWRTSLHCRSVWHATRVSER